MISLTTILTLESLIDAEILIADDQADVLARCVSCLRVNAFRSKRSVAGGRPDSLLILRVDVVLMDLNYARDTTSGSEGLESAYQNAGSRSTLPIVVMTAWGSVDLAVEAMRRGLATLFRSHGTTLVYWQCYAPRLNWPKRCAAGNASKQKNGWRDSASERRATSRKSWLNRRP